VLFSCKITHSLFTYLDRRGEDLEALYEKCDWPAEFLRDPSSWLEADKMETFLAQIDLGYSRGLQLEEGLVTSVGHQCKDLRSWGVLDSVLRMVQTPKDLFAQPERFLSYFISPAPPIGDLRRGPDSVSFVLPIDEVQFPHVTGYLRAALEALPTYISKPMAQVIWDNSHVGISWSENQVSLFGEAQDTDLSLNPELVRNILQSLEATQSQLEAMKCELHAKEEEILKLKSSSPSASVNPAAMASEIASASTLARLAQGASCELGGPLEQVLTELYRLGDYMARGQQLVTLLVGQGRQTPQVQEAMRRMDWLFVAQEGPQVIKRSVAGLQKMQESLRDLHLIAGNAEAPGSILEGDAMPSDLNEVVDQAILSARTQTRDAFQVDRQFLLDRSIRVNPLRMQQAVTNLLNNAFEALSPGGVVRVVTRPRGARVEIEITDTGAGMDASTLSRATEPFFTTKPAPAAGLGLAVADSIVRLHKGTLSLTSQPGRGSTVIIDLPLTN
jgi:signal transduction histidine kinase